MSLVPHNGRVAVVGAGVSGLTFSYFLLKVRPDVHISIFESQGRPGGWIHTENLTNSGSNILLEKGPRTLRGVSDGTLLIVDILRNLNLHDQVEVMKASSIGNRKWLLDPSNKLVQVPSSPVLFAKFMMSDVTDGLIPSILREPFQKRPTVDQDESIQSFILRRFGSPAIADNVLSAIMHGIYSGDVAKLSVQATLPSLVQMEKDHGSIVKSVLRKMLAKKDSATAPALNDKLIEYERHISPGADLLSLSKSLKKFPILRLHDGLQVLPNALSLLLQKQKNIEIHYGSPIESLDLLRGAVQVNGQESQFDHIRYTLGAYSLLSITAPQNVELQNILGLFEYSTIFLANVYSKKGGLVPAKGNGFGFLVPKRNTNPESLLGVIYDSDTELDAEKLFGGSQVEKASYDKVTLMMGGHYFSTRGVPSNKANVRAVKQVLSSILGVELSKFNLVVRDESKEASKEIHLGEDDLLISYNLHERCIPQYNVGFLAQANKMKKAVSTESQGKVSIGGTALGKLGVPDCVMNSLEDAMSFR